jgi:flagellar biosynthesis protein FlhA
LSEGVSIRNLSVILERVSDYATVSKNPDELSEYARRALGAQITKPLQSDNGSLKAITLDPKLEQQLAGGLRQTPTEIGMLLDPRLSKHVVDWVSRSVQQLLASGHPAIVLCAPHLRLAFKRFFETSFADLNVLSYAEVPPRTEIQSAAVVPSLELSAP